MTNWKETTLDEIAIITMGQSPLSESYNLIGDGLPFYQGVTEFGDKYVGIKSYTNSPTKVLEAGSILFSVRAPVGRVNFTKDRCCIGRGNAGLVMKNGEQEFLYYLLTHLERDILKNTTGTVFDSISGVELRKFPILVTELKEEQKEIAGVLSSLDDKIELLREENKTLEATAQTIFKEWFVNFNFPNAEGKPYKSSGGKMVDSELGKIPEGWRVGKLNEILDLKGGFAHDTKISGESISKIAKMGVVDGKNFFNRNSVIDYSGEIDKKYKLEEDDLIICTRDMTQDRVVIGNISIVPRDLAISGLYAGSNTWIIKSDLNKIFLFLLFREDSFRQHIIQSSKGTTIVMITRDSFLNCDITIPPSKFIDYIMESLHPIFKKIKNINSEIQTLSTLRDTLLPKLMSGEILIS